MKTKLTFITFGHVQEAVKHLVSGKDGDHLPVTDADGSPNHRLMGAAWAALHGGYRGNKYEGPNKAQAIAKLKAMYKAEKMDTPEESHSDAAGEFLEESLRKDDSFDAVRQKVMDAVNANIRSGTDMDCDDDGPQDAIEGKYAWCMDIFPGAVVYSMDGCLCQCDYEIDADGDVQLGTPMKVEMSYTPMAPGGDGDEEQESARAMCREASPIQEGAYDASKGELTIRVIESGFNKSKSRYYPDKVLVRDCRIFEGAKMFMDHQTEGESKARPEGSVKDWVASLGKPWTVQEGAKTVVMAKATVIDPQFKAKLDMLNEAKKLQDLGVSIRAVGEASRQTIGNTETNYVESLLVGRSVDFVTYAGAGGRVEAIEADRDENDVDLIGEADLRTRRPDLVALIESNSQKELKRMKSVEQQLQEATTSLTAATKKIGELEAQIAESNKKAAQTEIKRLISESKLPTAAKAKLEKQFAEAATTEGVAEAITAETDYLKQVGGTGAPARKNLGTEDNGSHEESGKPDKANLVESYKLLGLNENEAKLAAGQR